MAKTDIAVAELIWNLIARKTGNVSRTDFIPQKPAFDDYVPVQEAKEGQGHGEISLPRAVPENQGISSVRLTHFLKELAEKENTDIHQVLVARNGHVICECVLRRIRGESGMPATPCAKASSAWRWECLWRKEGLH